MEINDNSGGGGGTDFQSMPHQQMLNWLDQASSFYVRDASDRLERAATKMREIAGELKKRPGGVRWEGEAEKAFLEWTTSLASTTHSLADYSSHSASWLTQAADAIAAAQSAIPRYTSSAEAKENLAAAQKYHNDPDAQTIARNARTQMAPDGADAAAIKAKEEANRQAAAAEMERLSGAYEWSGKQMASFRLPSFQPPPVDFVPQKRDMRDGSSYLGTTPGSEARPAGTGTDAGTSMTRARSDGMTPPDAPVTPPSRDTTGPTHVIHPETPADLGIDSVHTLPPPTTVTPPPTTGMPPTTLTPPTTGQPPVPLPTPPFTVPPTPTPIPPVSGIKAPPVPGGRTGLGPNGPLPGMPREGITGGRPVPSNPGRPATGIPRSTVIGQEPTAGRTGTGVGRGPMAGPPLGGHAGGPSGGQSGISGGRRLASETGGVVGGRAQRPGAVGGRPFTPGGSGLVRGANEREESRGERPDYLVEDEETWQQGGRRTAPPVID
ncbi:hypothetical protein [Streptomyces sp. NPDC004267]|uniref:hypothetical protein n=1 Tax=Streptomyces sp. NPDC004267 TaxID=3364694 RepID=UPI0036B9F575